MPDVKEGITGRAGIQSLGSSPPHLYPLWNLASGFPRPEASPPVTLELISNAYSQGPSPDLRNQKLWERTSHLNFNKPCRWFWGTIKFENLSLKFSYSTVWMLKVKWLPFWKFQNAKLWPYFEKDQNDINSFPHYPQHGTSSPRTLYPDYTVWKIVNSDGPYWGRSCIPNMKGSTEVQTESSQFKSRAILGRGKTNILSISCRSLANLGPWLHNPFHPWLHSKFLPPCFHKLPSAKTRSLQPSEMFDSHDSNCC